MDDVGELEGVERRAFVAIASALVDDDVGDWIADAAAPLITRLDPGERRLLGMLLRALEATGAIVAGRAGRFSGASRDARQRVLARLARGPAPARQAVASLKALATLAYYGSPPGWRHAGYDGPWLGRVDVPVLPPPAPRGSAVAQVIDGRNATADLRLRANVCVIGAGAGGATMAARLAAAGVDVLLVEAGGETRAADFTQRELEMLPLLYQDAGLRATTDKAIGILQGRGVGGSTLHNTGLVYETPAAILDRWRADHAFPWTDAAWGEHVGHVTRTLGARPIPAHQIDRNNDVLRRGAAALGWSYTIARHNRVDCCGCGYCMIGCAYNRKLNASLTWIPAALAAGARVLTDARALTVRGRRYARCVTCELAGERGRPTGRHAEIDARIVVLAAGAIDTPALLQRSGLGGQRVGRGLRLHPSPLVYAEFAEPVTAWRGLPQSVIVDELASFMNGGHGGFLLLPSAGTQPALAAAGAPGIATAHRALMGRYPNIAIGVVLLHDETEGRVTPSRRGRPRVRYWPNGADTRELLRGIRALAHLYFAAGALRVWLPFAATPPVTGVARLDAALGRARPRPHTLTLNSVHPQGTCAIGPTRTTGAAAPHGELWDEPDIFVCDASLFPTSVGVPPQVTVMAFASAIAEHIAARAN